MTDQCEERFQRKYPEVAQRESALDLQNRFTHHPSSPAQVELYELVRGGGLNLASLLNAYCPASPELSRAIDCIDQAVMWANSSIARRS